MYRIFIVEDDATIAGTVKSSLESWGYEAQCTGNFQDVLAEFAKYQPQLVLLDISLPFYNGYHWCTKIRQISQIPIVFLSCASDNMNIVMAMNMGADDFIAKPFDLDVLLAKIQALLRRAYDFGEPENILSHNGAILDYAAGTLTWEGNQVSLTKNETKILKILMEQKGRAVSRENIMIKLWESDSFVDDNTLTVNVARLRKKLEEIGLEGFITTKKGMGYMVCRIKA